MGQYVKLYMNDKIMPMRFGIEIPRSILLSIENANRLGKNMSNCKSFNANLITSELLKWTRPTNLPINSNIINHAIKQVFLHGLVQLLNYHGYLSYG